LTVGCRIEHARFGQGTVTALTGTGIDAKATVKFDNVGSKQLLLRFAKFEVI
jgi:DNA helicase-2/ATP-dependent DNA helicase PcrA